MARKDTWGACSRIIIIIIIIIINININIIHFFVAPSLLLLPVACYLAASCVVADCIRNFLSSSIAPNGFFHAELGNAVVRQWYRFAITFEVQRPDHFTFFPLATFPLLLFPPSHNTRTHSRVSLTPLIVSLCVLCVCVCAFVLVYCLFVQIDCLPTAHC